MRSPPIGAVPGRGSSLVLTRMNGHYAASLAELVGEAGKQQSRSGRLRTELILAVGVVLEVVLVFGLGLPEGAGLADLGHDLAGPET